MVKQVILILIIFIGSTQVAYTEKISLSTYYPAPFGVYDQLRLVPRATLDGECRGGVFQVNEEDASLYFCRKNGSEEDGVWTKIVYTEAIKNIHFEIQVLKDEDIVLTEDIDSIRGGFSKELKTIIEDWGYTQQYNQSPSETVRILSELLLDVWSRHNDDIIEHKKEIVELKVTHQKEVGEIELRVEALENQVKQLLKINFYNN